MEHRIETREVAVGMAYRLTGDYKSCDYGKAWQQLMKYCETNKDALGDCWSEVEYINMYYDDPMQTPPAECRVDVCMVAKAASRRLQEVFGSLIPADGVQRITIPGGRYVVFTHKGPYDKLGETYGYIYGEYLPNGEVVDDSKARGGMFEIYLNDPDTTKSEDLLTELWIPIV